MKRKKNRAKHRAQTFGFARVVESSRKAILSIAILTLALAGATNASADTCESADLFAGQDILVGMVVVCHDADTVTFNVNAPWCIQEAHVAVGSAVGEIPQTNGNPQPGQFPYSDFPGCQNQVVFDVDEDITDGTIVAAHAVVENQNTWIEETAWGAGFPFPGANWATYVFVGGGEPPIGCGDADGSKCVFVTTPIYKGDLGGLAGADMICQNLADADDSVVDDGTYKAWLSTTDMWPITRFSQDNGGACGADPNNCPKPYKLADGTQIAANWVDLTDGTLNHAIELHWNGAETPRTLPLPTWTFTRSDGDMLPLALPSRFACLNWTTSSLGSGSSKNSGHTGLSSETDFQWTDAAFDAKCSERAALYCFQQ